MEILIIKCSDLAYVQEPDEDERFNTMTAVVSGVVVDENDENISISGFYFPNDGTARSVITIPKSVIYYQRRVRIPDKVKEE